MRHLAEQSIETVAKKGFYAVVIGVTVVLVQVVIDLIYAGQL